MRHNLLGCYPENGNAPEATFPRGQKAHSSVRLKDFVRFPLLDPLRALFLTFGLFNSVMTENF